VSVPDATGGPDVGARSGDEAASGAPDGSGRERRTVRLQVRRTARVVMLGTPSAATRQVWLACHGYGQLAASFADSLNALRSPERVVVVPEALNRYYLDDHGYRRLLRLSRCRP
jgi:hypothetical protein